MLKDTFKDTNNLIKIIHFMYFKIDNKHSLIKSKYTWYTSGANQYFSIGATFFT
jgi:hypothetical protein